MSVSALDRALRERGIASGPVRGKRGVRKALIQALREQPGGLPSGEDLDQLLQIALTHRERQTVADRESLVHRWLEQGVWRQLVADHRHTERETAHQAWLDGLPEEELAGRLCCSVFGDRKPLSEAGALLGLDAEFAAELLSVWAPRYGQPAKRIQGILGTGAA